MFAAFGPDPDMQLYDRGLRRRLPTMLGGDPRRIRMVYSLLFSLPGTPVLFYGEEIGMGENLAAEGRLAVRTPMQWTSGVNGGFSRAPKRALSGPVTEGGFSPEHVNVADQRRDPDSLLTFVQLLVRRYRECPELGWTTRAEILDQPHPAVLAHRSTWDDGSLVALHNLGTEPVMVPLRLADCDDTVRLVDLLQDGSCTIDARRPHGGRARRLRLPLAARDPRGRPPPALTCPAPAPEPFRATHPSARPADSQQSRVPCRGPPPPRAGPEPDGGPSCAARPPPAAASPQQLSPCPSASR